MIIHENYSLKHLNTFGIDATAAHCVEVTSVAEIQTLLSDEFFQQQTKLILGGGSNLLFTKNFEGIVVKNNIKGLHIIAQTEDYVRLKVGAGEVWHDVVMHCVKHNYGGVENLSLIPGSIGAGPMQNIGAYGVELKEVFYELEAVSIKDGILKTFSKVDCKFGYRNSIFKHEVKGQYIITSVTLELNKKPTFNTKYGAIETELQQMGITQPSVKAISEAVCNIRRSKLPNPAEIGNAGSFFKNPEVPTAIYNELKQRFNAIVGYETPNGMKLAAGWLIEQCGWKGKRIGNAGVHTKQALVLVNYGDATGEEIITIARSVQQSVKEKFGVDLEMEVNIV
jgi:UDP-N-acetylmuramate dehydrogenase